MANPKTSIDEWITRALKADPPRSKSLIVTIFGDAIVPSLPAIWLADLIALLAPFGVNERLVRTSSFRLMEEGWLKSSRAGRRSRYSLTPSGLHRVEHAYHRIYDPPPMHWDGNWTLVFLNKQGNLASSRVELRRELEWEGFGSLSPGIFLHPSADLATLREILSRLKLTHSVTILQAHDLQAAAVHSGPKLAAACWNLELVAERYRKFINRFRPALERLSTGVNTQSAFVLQTLLIHSFRRVVLHDPRLPAALLPRDWPGHHAYNLCRDIYRLTYEQAQVYLADQLGASPDSAYDQPLKVNEMLDQRFGGLSDRNPVEKRSPARRQKQ